MKICANACAGNEKPIVAAGAPAPTPFAASAVVHKIPGLFELLGIPRPSSTPEARSFLRAEGSLGSLSTVVILQIRSKVSQCLT
jgi:hypothetical protein